MNLNEMPDLFWLILVLFMTDNCAGNTYSIGASNNDSGMTWYEFGKIIIISSILSFFLKLFKCIFLHDKYR